MSRVKEIELKVIPAKIANDFVKKHHYSGKVVSNSFLHFGAFLDKRLHGVMSFGHSLDKAKTQKLVKNTGWNEFCELNRMAFDDYLPRNSESYCIGKALDLKYKDDYLFTNNSGNGFGCSFTDDKDEFVIKDKKDNEKK